MADNSKQTVENENGVGKKEIISIVLNLAKIFFIIMLIYYVIKLFGGFTGVSGKNIKYYSKSDNAVYVYSVCSERDHVGDKWEAKISSGEDCTAMEICDACGYAFDIYVKRK